MALEVKIRYGKLSMMEMTELIHNRKPIAKIITRN